MSRVKDLQKQVHKILKCMEDNLFLHLIFI